MFKRGATKQLSAVILLWGLGSAACSDQMISSSERDFSRGTSKRNPDKVIVRGEQGDHKKGHKKPPKEPNPVIHDDAPIETNEDAPQGNQMLSPVDVYCSNDTVKYNGDVHFMNSQAIKFRFYDNKKNIYTSSNSLPTPNVRDIFTRSNELLMPVFVGLPNGQYDLLLCEESKIATCSVDFNAIFEFTPYESVYYGKARGLVGIIRKVNVENGRFANFDKLSLIYPAQGHAQTCTTEIE